MSVPNLQFIPLPLPHWASLVAQLVKNPPAMQETLVPWRRKWQPTPVFCLENSMDGGTWRANHQVTKSQTWLSDFHFHFSPFPLGNHDFIFYISEPISVL